MCSQSLQGRAADSPQAKEELESEDAEKERREEEDDPELLQRARSMDEYKDGKESASFSRSPPEVVQVLLRGLGTDCGSQYCSVHLSVWVVLGFACMY